MSLSPRASLIEAPMSKAQRTATVQRLIDTAPSSWKTMFQRYNLGNRPTPSQLINTVLEYTPSMGSSSAYFGEKGGGHRVPKEVAQEALLGLKLSHRHDYTSASGIGLVRAMQLYIEPAIWDRSVKRMSAYFDRHKRDKMSANFGNNADPSRGYMAWLNWGGDSGKVWADEITQYRRNPNDFTLRLVEPKDIEFIGFDPAKLQVIRPLIPLGLQGAREITNSNAKFPSPVVALSPSEIAHGRTIVDEGHKLGAGHGMYNPNTYQVKVNPNMEPIDILANLIHENLHHLNPAASEMLVDKGTSVVMNALVGEPLRGRPYSDERHFLRNRSTYEDSEGRSIPDRYLAGLSASDRKKRIKEIGKRRDEYDRMVERAKKKGKKPSKKELEYVFRPYETDKGGPRRASKYTIEAEKRGIVGSLEEKAKAASKLYGGKVPVHILKKVYGKGIAAWASGGHRPGASQFNWANARVNSFLTGGKTFWTADKKLAAELPKKVQDAIKRKAVHRP
jgi:hypothetical protein